MRLLCVVLLLFPTFGLASPIAEVICSPTSDMVKKLTDQYGSARAARGVRGPEQVMEVWTDAGGEWAMVVRYSNGQSCIVAFGEDWQALEGHDAS